MHVYWFDVFVIFNIIRRTSNLLYDNCIITIIIIIIIIILHLHYKVIRHLRIYSWSSPIFLYVQYRVPIFSDRY